MPKKSGEENSKKAAGNARKAANAAAKAEAENARKASIENAEWAKGAKGASKKEAEAEKKAEAARKKAEREALLAAEMESIKAAKPSATKDKSKKAAPPPTPRRGIDAALSGMDGGDDQKKLPALTASGIDDALEALDITHGADTAIDRHPERRKAAAYRAYEERRLPELREEYKGLRLGQLKEMLRKEFEKSPENPMNQLHKIVSYDATKEEIQAKKEAEKLATEQRLASNR